MKPLFKEGAGGSNTPGAARPGLGWAPSAQLEMMGGRLPFAGMRNG